MTDDIMLMGKNPNFLGSWDLYDVPGNEITVSIKEFRNEEVINNNGQKEVCAVCYFNENIKPMIMNITNRKTISRLYHTKNAGRLKDKPITIGLEKVKSFGKISDALRIRNIVPRVTPAKEAEIFCEQCKKPILAVRGMSAVQVAEYTKKKYGKALCRECAEKACQETGGAENHGSADG